MTSQAHDSAAPDDGTSREQAFARRALLRAGWVIPAVIVLDAAPAFAVGSTPPHTDLPGVPHTDTTVGHTDVGPIDQIVPHTDIEPRHVDLDVPYHVDLDISTPGGPQHVDFDGTNHVDDDTGVPHVDQDPWHQDTDHQDEGVAVHTDTPAQPHVDA